MLVGVLADTHHQLPKAVFQIFADCDLILHAGDIGTPQIIQELSAIAPVYAVLGNIDSQKDYPGLSSDYLVTLAGQAVYMTHTPTAAEHYLRQATGQGGAPRLPEICIHGHTHQARNELLYNVHIVNPGSTTSPKPGHQPSVALLTLTPGSLEKVTFHALA
ncbi:MAG: metallophosphatase family protein [Coriobacteriia bacterium]|nr:metallophosphatase family protein [Coriobacteriia bacterium]